MLLAADSPVRIGSSVRLFGGGVKMICGEDGKKDSPGSGVLSRKVGQREASPSSGGLGKNPEFLNSNGEMPRHARHDHAPSLASTRKESAAGTGKLCDSAPVASAVALCGVARLRYNCSYEFSHSFPDRGAADLFEHVHDLRVVCPFAELE